MQRPRQIIMDMKAIFMTHRRRPEARLDVPRRANSDVNRTIEIEFIIKHVVIITHSRDTPHHKHDILRNTNICWRRMPLDRVSGIEFKQADTTWVGVGGFTYVVGGVEIGGVGGTV